MSKLESSYESVKNMMQLDGCDNDKILFIDKIMKIILNSKNFMDNILKDVKQVLKDKKIDSNDFPILMMIGLQSKDFLDREMDNAIDLKKLFFPNALKYIIFGVIYFALLELNADEQMLICFKLVFPSLWNLINVDPKKVLLQSKSLLSRLSKLFSCVKK